MAGIRNHLLSLTTQARRMVDEATAGFWTADDVTESIELGFQEVWAECVSRGQDWSMRTKTVSVVSGTELYDLPDFVMRVRRVGRVQSDGSIVPLLPLRSVDENYGQSGSWLADNGRGTRWYLEGLSIGFRPKPTEAWSAQVKYIPMHPSPTTGTAAGGAASTITLSSADGRDDYYVGAEIAITSGTGSGQSRRIAAYVGSTKVATLSTAWTTTPDATSVYATSPLCPEYCMKWGVLEAVCQMEIKDKATRQEVMAERERARKIAVRHLRLRQTQRPMRVRMIDPDNRL